MRQYDQHKGGDDEKEIINRINRFTCASSVVFSHYVNSGRCTSGMDILGMDGLEKED